MKSGSIKVFFLLAIAAGFISSCRMKSAYYQQQVSVPGANWSSKFMPAFKLEITDTAADYYCFLMLRHDEAYPNSNLWLRLKVKAPGEKSWTEGPRLEVPLANASGVWLGRGMGGIWEHRIYMPQEAVPKFKKPGTYEIKLEQLMRVDPLPAILNVGLTVQQIRK